MSMSRWTRSAGVVLGAATAMAALLQVLPS